MKIATFACPANASETGPADAFAGIEAVPSPGQTCYVLHARGEALMIWGDTVHWPAVQIAQPEVGMIHDTDPEMAAVSGRNIFDMVATDRMLAAGMHMGFPGFGHLLRDRSTYRHLPAALAVTLWGQDAMRP